MGLFDFLKKKTAAQKIVIDDHTFRAHQYQQDMLAFVVAKYYELDHSYEAVSVVLKDLGHDDAQVENLIAKLKAKIKQMVSEFEEAERTGVIKEIKIIPNEEHFKNIGDTKQADRYIAYGCYQMEKGDLANALELFDAGIKINPREYKGYANKASALSQMGKVTEALVCYNEAIALDPRDVRVYLGKGDLLESEGNYKEAVGCYLVALSLESNNLDILSSIAICYGNCRDEENAIKYFDKIIELDDDNLEARLNKSNALFLSNNISADTFYYDLISRYPYQQEAVVVKPLYLERLGKYNEALLVFDDLRDRMNDIVYFKMKAYFLYERNKQSAIAACDAYLVTQPDDNPMLSYKTQLLKELGLVS